MFSGWGPAHGGPFSQGQSQACLVSVCPGGPGVSPGAGDLASGPGARVSAATAPVFLSLGSGGHTGTAPEGAAFLVGNVLSCAVRRETSEHRVQGRLCLGTVPWKGFEKRSRPGGLMGEGEAASELRPEKDQRTDSCAITPAPRRLAECLADTLTGEGGRG